MDVTQRRRSRRLEASSIAGLFLLSLGIIAAAPASAQQTTASRMSGLALSDDQPIQIESDRLQVLDAEGKAVFSGNVRVVQGATQMRSGEMTVYYAKDGGDIAAGTSQIDRIDVTDDVYIKTEEQEATADSGSFDMRTEVVELSGEKVVLTDGENVFVGCKLTVFMKSGEARLDSCGDRVRIQLDPQSNQRPGG